MTIRCNSRFHPNSYPRPPHGGRPTNSKKSSASWQFLSTPSAWRATIDLYVTANANALFLSTPSAWRATLNTLYASLQVVISIHALRMEGDLFTVCNRIALFLDFYPRPPHGGRLFDVIMGLGQSLFLSTPSAWRATLRLWGLLIYLLFLSTPSAWRATTMPLARPAVAFYFYPRPPHGGRPFDLQDFHFHPCNFYPRPPHGGRH